MDNVYHYNIFKEPQDNKDSNILVTLLNAISSKKKLFIDEMGAFNMSKGYSALT